jgi:hypothetical protein
MILRLLRPRRRAESTVPWAACSCALQEAASERFDHDAVLPIFSGVGLHTHFRSASPALRLTVAVIFVVFAAIGAFIAVRREVAQDRDRGGSVTCSATKAAVPPNLGDVDQGSRRSRGGAVCFSGTPGNSLGLR